LIFPFKFEQRGLFMTAPDRDLDSLLASMLPRIWSFAFRLTHDERLAEELVLRASRYWLDHVCRTSKSTSPLVQMLWAIQATWLAEENDESDQALCEPGCEHKRLEAKKQSRDPIMAVAGLPKLPRIVMILIHAEGLSYAEAAEAVGVHVSHVRQLIRQAQLLLATAKNDVLA
jgi:RNA polymerase sigma-70 factor, ECF subfamily